MENPIAYIVTAHLPIDPNDPIFEGELALGRAEWTIYEGPRALLAARNRAENWARYFRSVNVRPVGEIVR